MKFSNKSIQISAIRKSKFHWDREISNESVADLADSIEKTGQIAPVIVRPIGKAKRFYELLAGERRYLAQKQLGATSIDCRVVHCSDLEAQILSLEENLKFQKPSSKEWDAAMKVLRDLYIQRDGKFQDEKPKSSGKKGQLLGAAPNNAKPGRKPSPTRAANQKVAKTLGVSESKVKRGIKREENLIHSAAKAMENGNITVEQADRLAGMPVKQQRIQLPIMIKETREQTRSRMDRERAEETGEMTSYALRAMRVVTDDAKNLGAKVNAVHEYMSDRDLDYDVILKDVDLNMLSATGQGLLDLVDFLR